jgi:hypothetical protein
MTLSAWVYPLDNLPNWQSILLKETDSSLAYHLQLAPGNFPTTYITTDIAGLQGIVAPQAIPLYTWSYLAATYDGETLSLYVNGQAVASQSVTGNIIPSVGPLRLGGNQVFGEFFVGTLDDVRVYSRALSQAEIIRDMNTPVEPR